MGQQYRAAVCGESSTEMEGVSIAQRFQRNGVAHGVTNGGLIELPNDYIASDFSSN
jgi:hypothetical protein